MLEAPQPSDVAQVGRLQYQIFHNLASFNRNKKIIWSIQNDRAEILRGQAAIKEEAVAHFKHLFKANSCPNLTDKLAIASLYPKLVSSTEATDLYKPVTLQEIKDILIHFKKERSPGPDGWTTEFFSPLFRSRWIGSPPDGGGHSHQR
jgi:hypothetical protein